MLINGQNNNVQCAEFRFNVNLSRQDTRLQLLIVQKSQATRRKGMLRKRFMMF